MHAAARWHTHTGMSDKHDDTASAGDKQQRLAEALRANLRRRKQQTRARRRAGPEDGSQEPDAKRAASGSDDVST